MNDEELDRRLEEGRVDRGVDSPLLGPAAVDGLFVAASDRVELARAARPKAWRTLVPVALIAALAGGGAGAAFAGASSGDPIPTAALHEERQAFSLPLEFVDERGAARSCEVMLSSVAPAGSAEAARFQVLSGQPSTGIDGQRIYDESRGMAAEITPELQEELRREAEARDTSYVSASPGQLQAHMFERALLLELVRVEIVTADFIPRMGQDCFVRTELWSFNDVASSELEIELAFVGADGTAVSCTVELGRWGNSTPAQDDYFGQLSDRESMDVDGQKIFEDAQRLVAESGPDIHEQRRLEAEGLGLDYVPVTQEQIEWHMFVQAFRTEIGRGLILTERYAPSVRHDCIGEPVR